MQAQNYYQFDEEGFDKYVRASKKPYKILYIFCTYCNPPQYNMSIDSLVIQHKSDSIEFIPFTCQFKEEGLPYIVKHGIQSHIYFVEPIKRKRKRFGFIVIENPVNDASKILERFDSVHTNTGAGGYIILDAENRPIMWSDYKTQKDGQSFLELKEFIRRH